MKKLILLLFPFVIYGQSFKSIALHGYKPTIATGGGITNTTLGLVNWWKLDENTGTTTVDSVGSANGTLTGTALPTWTNGIINSALRFNGNLSFPSPKVQLSANTISGSSGLTICAWINFTDDQDGVIFYDSDLDQGKGFFFFVQVNNHTIELDVSTSGNDLVHASGVDAISPGSWIHLTTTWTGVLNNQTTIHFYTNAVETNYGSGANGTGTHAANTTTDRYLGYNPTVGSQSLSGSIDDIRIYNRVLSIGEITNIFQWRGEP